MITMNIPAGNTYRVVNPFKAADRAALDAATTVTVTVFGADKAPILRESAAKLAHFGYALGGLTVETSEITDGEEYSMTIRNIRPGVAREIGIIATRMVGRQQGIVAAEALTQYAQRSKIRKQFIKQFAPSVCAGGSDLRDCTDAKLFSNQGYLTYIDPIFQAYGLYQHGSVTL